MLKRIFTQRNILSLVVVLIGIIGVFGIPQRYGFTDQQLLIGIVSFVALETIVLNATYLDDISKGVRYLVARSDNVEVDQVLSPENIKVALRPFVGNAKRVVVVGISLDRLVLNEVTTLRDLIVHGCKVQLIISDPNALYLDAVDLGMATEVSAGVQRSHAQSFLARVARLHEGLNERQRKLLDVRMHSSVPSYSATWVTTRGGRGDVIHVSYYAYGKSPAERRAVRLVPRSAPENFQFYAESIEEVVAIGKVVDLPSYREQG